MTSIAIDRRTGLKSSAAVKAPCKVATTTNITLSGEQTINGVAVVENDRVLVWTKTDARDNGIYDVSTGNWQRSADFRDNRDILTGTQVYVTSGTVNAECWFGVTTADPIVIGTSNVTFALSDNSAAAIAAAAAAEAAQAAAEAAAVAAGVTIQAAVDDLQTDINEVRALATAVPNYKPAVNVMATSNVSIASGLEAGDTVSGEVLVAGWRVGVGGQAAPAENGIYDVPVSGSASRSSDMNSAADFLAAQVYVLAGTNAGKRFVFVPAVNPPIIGTTAISVEQIGDDALPETLTQLIGPSSVVTGSTIAGNTTWVMGEPVAYDGYLSQFKVYVSADGPISIRKFSKSGDTFTQVDGSFTVFATAGANTFLRTNTSLPLIDLAAGEYLGFFARAGIVTYVSESNSGFWSGAGDLSTFVDAVLQTNLRLQMSYGIQQTARGISDEKFTRLNGAMNRGQQFIGLGKSVVPDATGSVAAAYTFVFANPALSSGYVTQVTGGFTGAGTMFLKRFTKSGDDFSQIGPDYPVEVTTTGAININVAGLPYIPVNAGEYIGVFRGNARFTYKSFDDGINLYADPYYAPTTTGNVTSFSDSATAQVALQLHILVTLDAVAGLRKGMDDITASTGSDTVISGDVYYADTVTASEASVADLDVNVVATVNRDGDDLAIAETVTLTAATSGYVRYDVISLDMATDTLVVAAGTERTTDAIAFKPAITDPRDIPLYLARIAATSISTTPLWRLRDGVDLRIADQIDLDMQRTRRLMPKTMRKLRNGSALAFGGFGTSITAIQAETPSSSVPNGEYRDRATAVGTTFEYLAATYGSDVLAAIPKFTAAQLGRTPDANGAIYTKVGWNWEIVAALERQGYVLGTDLSYDNFGVGGQASDDAWASGSPTAWLAAAIALNWDWVVIDFGMNERGNTGTEDRLVSIANAFTASGTEVILLDCPRPQSGTFSDWLYTNRAIRRAAIRANVGHVSFAAVSDDRFLGALGIDSADICRGNGSNHPGKEELAAYGAFLSRVFSL